mmetsp:Transcript_39879/g.58587  ORF Transcript_39879/g.58587 Transcript_39879/m.58587 type:complete len:320 (-) Transcript_39879:156-1115(-)|eukprot:CAMPEP_0195521400 /NCGR_PEP_ID=MMETSP0794_2-20130614/18603_1 /TAXON_ID=515487 /ORGANISM="Stephanopyxis turris, Strain CCMP 815" /LENGTH=319 /DNA_ID=CAMNT_0040650945 /DNA_START=69 /DNA_END=1028 /DNA_ORIENTATION=+
MQNTESKVGKTLQLTLDDSFEMTESHKTSSTPLFDEDTSTTTTDESFSDGPALSTTSTDQIKMETFSRVTTGKEQYWSAPDANTFKVRGRKYLTNGKKIGSEPFLFPARGVDFFRTKQAPQDIASHVLATCVRKTPTFLINFRLPFGVLMFYFEIPAKFLPSLQCRYEGRNDPETTNWADMSPSERTICKFLMASDAERNENLKLIPRVIEGPWVVRKTLAGKPVIIGKKVPIQYFYHPAEPSLGNAAFFEAALDVGDGVGEGKNVIMLCRKHIEKLAIDIGVVVQGNTQNELPEQMLAAARFHRLSVSKAPKFPFGHG